MRKVKGHELLSVLSRLSKMNDVADNNPDWVYADNEKIQFLNLMLDGLLSQLSILNLRLSKNKAEEIKRCLTLKQPYSTQVTAKRVSISLEALKERIEEELEDCALYYLDSPSAELIETGASVFGSDVANKFPESITDLGEATQCLGLSRNTACVFHLMRAMEQALYVIGNRFDAAILDKNDRLLTWGQILYNVNDKVQEMPHGEDRNNWSSILALLYHVKDCWRNSTMHPRDTYSNQEAHEVFMAVKAFLNRLAREL